MEPKIIAAMAAMVLTFSVPLVAILTYHQRKMAELMHRRPDGNVDMEMLRREVQELKSLVHQQTLAIDSLRNSTTTHDSGLSQRVGGG